MAQSRRLTVGLIGGVLTTIVVTFQVLTGDVEKMTADGVVVTPVLSPQVTPKPDAVECVYICFIDQPGRGAFHERMVLACKAKNAAWGDRDRWRNLDRWQGVGFCTVTLDLPPEQRGWAMGNSAYHYYVDDAENPTALVFAGTLTPTPSPTP